MRHFIGKEILEIKLHRKSSAFEIQQTLSRQFRNQIHPAMEKIFDQSVDQNQLIQIDQLVIDLGSLSESELLSGKWINLVLEKIKAAIEKEKAIQIKNNQIISLDQGQFQKWLYFLREGTIPHLSALPNKNWQLQILETIGLRHTAAKSLSNLLKQHPIALERLILQHPPQFLGHILELFTAQNQTRLVKVGHELNKTFQKILLKKWDDKVWLEWNEAYLSLIKQQITSKSIYAKKDTKNLSTASIESQASASLNTFLGKLLSKNSLNLNWKQWQEELERLLPQIQKQASSSTSENRQQTGKAPELSSLQGEKKLETSENKRAKESLALELERLLATIHTVRQHLDGLKNEMQPNEFIQRIKDWGYRSGRELEVHFWKQILNLYINTGLKAKPITYLNILFSEDPVFRTLLPLLIKLDEMNELEIPELSPILKKLTKKLANEINKPASYQHDKIYKSVKALGEMQENPTAVSSKSNQNTWFCTISGLVLLNPFLSRFFEKRALLKEKEFVDDWSQQKAALLLFYLATGNDEPLEYEMVLPKLMTGIPFHEPLDSSIKLSEEDKEEAEELLEAVIENWGALGSASPEGLRGGFLVRSGKLTYQPKGWHLQIERETRDILLDRLPWGLGITKLPWMEELLFVDWN